MTEQSSTPHDRLKLTMSQPIYWQHTTDSHIRAALMAAYLDGVDGNTINQLVYITRLGRSE